MKITKKSIISGKEVTMDLPITEEQIRRWEQGELAQRVFPNLTPDQREFLISGITPGEWNKIFKE